jgi:hypothetical protein
MNKEDIKNLFSIIKQGDIILFGGSDGLMGKLIRYFDNATYTHIGIIVLIENIPFVLDMWSRGIELVPLTKRLKIYSKYLVLRPTTFLNDNDLFVKNILKEWENNRKIGYDYFLLLRIAIAKKLKIDIIAWRKKNKWICSELVQEYCGYFTNTYENIHLITPQDFVRYKDEKIKPVFNYQ